MELLLSKLLFLILLAVPPAVSSPHGFRAELRRIDSGHNLTKFELLQRATQRSHHRMSRLTGNTPSLSSKAAAAASSSIVNPQAPVHAGNGEFIMDLSIGTPAVPFSAILDTGSDLIWTQCKPCVDCFDQPSPIFDPSKSSSFSKLPCSGNLCSALPTSTCSSDSACEYLYTYGDSSSTQGVLASDTLTFSSGDSAQHIAFGCGDDNQGGGFSQAAGLVGLGRGPLSIISQLDIPKFSYCLTSLDDASKKSPLLFGSLAEMNGTVQSTPLKRSSNQPSFYYLTLNGITVGSTRLKIPSTAFELQDDGTGGLIIDSGTSITYLDVSAYKILKTEFLRQVKLDVADGSDVGLDLCFKGPASGSSESVEVPKLLLHFDGADLDLPGENYMVLDSDTGLLCLTVMGSSGMSILGNFQQQNMQILYDLEGERLSFMPAQCDQL